MFFLHTLSPKNAGLLHRGTQVSTLSLTINIYTKSVSLLDITVFPKRSQHLLIQLLDDQRHIENTCTWHRVNKLPLYYFMSLIVLFILS